MVIVRVRVISMLVSECCVLVVWLWLCLWVSSSSGFCSVVGNCVSLAVISCTSVGISVRLFSSR